mmetsp:Transcript_108321/g.316887  ORF Transcript_108321/g.316887 Transcript_108321/m.316887 type:complete len:249 (+) Transcript_108321:441-1187(+)
MHQLLQGHAIECVPQHFSQVLAGDRASAAAVEPRKGLSQERLARPDPAQQHTRQELVVLDLLVVVGVQALKEGLGFSSVDMEVLFERLPELPERDSALLVQVHEQELLLQICHVLRRERPRHHGQHHAAEVRGLSEAAQTRQDVLANVSVLGLAPLEDPWVLQGSCCGHPLGGIPHNESLHEGLCRLREPVEAGAEVGTASLDLPRDLLLRAAKRRRSSEEHVHNHAERPHVGLYCVGVREDLWRHVV